MSSIEKAIERMIAKKNRKSNSRDDFGTVENLDEASAEINKQEIKKAESSELLSKQENTPSFTGTQQQPIAGNEKKICHLDYTRLDEAGFLTPINCRQKLAEEYRIIKRPILINAFNKGAAPVKDGNLVAITSARSGEGKTYTSFNLAASIALELDTTILLVDTDILKASLTKQLGLESEPGLMDVLSDSSVNISDVIMATDMPRLSIIPSGNLSSNPTELLASNRMQNLMQEVSKRYSDRIVLFDTPPLMETTESSVIVNLMGQVIVVVEASSTTTDIIQAAVAKINPEKVIGMILNKSRRMSDNTYYGGYIQAEEKSSQAIEEL